MGYGAIGLAIIASSSKSTTSSYRYSFSPSDIDGRFIGCKADRGVLKSFFWGKPP
jgi:hypothetical protein